MHGTYGRTDEVQRLMRPPAGTAA